MCRPWTAQTHFAKRARDAITLVIIAPLYGAIFQQFVSKDIHSEADLKGQAHCRRPGSGDLAISEALYAAMGMTFEDFEPLYLGSTEGAETMKDGHADGAIALTQLPFSTFVELTNADKAYLIPWARYHRRHV